MLLREAEISNDEYFVRINLLQRECKWFSNEYEWFSNDDDEGRGLFLA